MEKLYTLKELEEMKKATIKGAFNVLAKQMGKDEYTARELSEMTNGLLSSNSIAARSSIGWYEGGRKIYQAGFQWVGGGEKSLAELDANGNIVRRFTMKLPAHKVYIYKLS